MVIKQFFKCFINDLVFNIILYDKVVYISKITIKIKSKISLATLINNFKVVNF